MFHYSSLCVVLAFVLVSTNVCAQDVVPLIDTANVGREWTFGNGSEFPGATGSLSVDADEKRQGRASLKLVGDFTRGGGYVQAGRKIEQVDIRELSMWVRSPDTERFTLRLSDATGQTHQIAVKLEATPDWQQVVLPLERFFASRGQAEAVTGIAKYESWGGAKDGKWHGPATAIYLLVSKTAESKVRTLWLNEVSIVPKPVAVAGAEVKRLVHLSEIIEGEHDWQFSDGREFPGAKGSLSVAADEPAKGQSCLKLAGDFTGGGGYVAAIRNLNELEIQDIPAVRMRVKSDNAANIGVQLVDGGGQTHQRRDVPIPHDGAWHDFTITPTEIAGGEHWGGANDGKWHGPLRQMVLTLTPRSDKVAKKPVLYLADIRAEALLPAFAQPAAFKSDFESALPAEWTVNGAALDTTAAFKGSQSLLLSRSLDDVNKPCTATSPTFPVAPGRWEVKLASKADLRSPDNSYNAMVTLECLDRAGKVIEQFTVADIFGEHDWQAATKLVELPHGVASARFQMQLNKTHGKFWVDELSASYLVPAPQRDDRIARVLFSTAQLGNLLFPTDPRKVSVTVECRKPLREHQRTLTFVVRDYWGAEQTRPATTELKLSNRKSGGVVYNATLDLAEAPLEVGRYYEVHATIPQGEAPSPNNTATAEPFRANTSLAILPEAETKRFKPEEVPFTSRNWDNRITEYVRLTDRLGIRICGIWGSWSSQSPYKAEAPSLELATQLGMGWLTTTPIAKIERGDEKYDEQALREGVRNLIDKYGKHRPLIINLGNEPHGTGERVVKNVAAYRAVYEEVKKIDPTIPVVATSVEPNEEYFRAGYGQWCDAFDFHIYEDSANVRRTIEEYRTLQRKYGVEKPIWSTELGLNSQGLTRHTVATELIKKFATFFAAGGKNVSWFGLLYPDPEGKLHGSSGDAHNVFDCRYNRYSPRLDAVAYYHMVNAIGIKTFIAEKTYPDGIHAFLFRDHDQRNLQVLWKDKGRQDVLVPLPNVGDVQVIRIDGSRRRLQADGRGVTLTISEDPLLVLYNGGSDATLPDVLDLPYATLTPPQRVTRRGESTWGVTFSIPATNNVELVTPPFWSLKTFIPSQNENGKDFILPPPDSSAVRDLDLTIRLRDPSGKLRGELYGRVPVAD